MSAKEGWRLRETITDWLLHTFYILLWLQYRLQTLFRRIPIPTRRRALSSVTVPRHVAFSGAVGTCDVQLFALIDLVVARGAKHVTLYDPWTVMTLEQVADRIRSEHAAKGRRIAVSVVDKNGTMSDETRVYGILSDAAKEQKEHVSDLEPDIKVTVVQPGASRGMLVRAVRTLGDGDFDGKELSIANVTEWLDETAEGMLPSEPDVVIVFPSDDPALHVNLLNGFPVWQLRLTQIRFAKTTVRDTTHDSLLEMVGSAAAAPKRFGR